MEIKDFTESLSNGIKDYVCLNTNIMLCKLENDEKYKHYTVVVIGKNNSRESITFDIDLEDLSMWNMTIKGNYWWCSGIMEALNEIIKKERK